MIDLLLGMVKMSAIQKNMKHTHTKAHTPADTCICLYRGYGVQL